MWHFNCLRLCDTFLLAITAQDLCPCSKTAPSRLPLPVRKGQFLPFISTYNREETLAEHFPPARAKKYTQDHEWVDLPPSSNVATIGISTYAAHALGDVVFVELPTLNESFSLGDTIAAVESVKSASDIKAPVACTVIEVNDLLEKSPSVMGTKPEDTGAEGGWLAKIELSEDGLKELEGLMGEKEYEAFIAE